ncbi:DUF3800 domain-containing protein [Hymenobacter arizonensis]|uniref:DUF3800 domain-containing protein n=1 Tax=Hymenobacter arizonensis TaxID=1227077 RepID=A0A1I5UK90_HYMAR|nr:DUF3800 domain-containing protein [Hymenobacter arizonensis]SFP95650.1 hypothetical protein SAMN04515668_0960 [Hymenobacter arizonensis]
MGHFYVDDSVHNEAGFIIGACVYTEIDLSNEIDNIIEKHGYDKTEFEHKSGASYSKDPNKIKVREGLKQLLIHQCKLGVVVIPSDQREKLGFECIKAIKTFIVHNNLKDPNDIYFDQGHFMSRQKAQDAIDAQNFTDSSFILEQDSRVIKGIQLADLAAHVASMHFKSTLHLITKMVKSGENSGYEPDSDMELGFEMWATLRYTFFNKGTSEHAGDHTRDSMVKVEPYGLYVSELCSIELQGKARQAFADVYLGCIH